MMTAMLAATSNQSFAAIFISSVLLTISPSNLAADATDDSRFKEIYTKEWTWRQGQRGEVDEDSAGRRRGVSSQLPKVDVATQQARLQFWTDVMKQLDGIHPDKLSPEQRTNYVVYRAQIEVLIEGQKFREYEKPLNADTAFWSNITGAARRPFRNQRDYTNYIAQLAEIPRYFDDQVLNMRGGLKRGFTPPKVTLTGRDASIVSVTEAKSPEDTIFYQPFKRMPDTIPVAEQSALRAKAASVIHDAVIPAHLALLKFMRNEYVPGTRDELAAESLPDGKAYYQSKILEFTTTKLTPSEIHQLGLEEVAKIHSEMLDVIKKTSFQGDFPAFLKFLRTDSQFYAKTPEELLMRASYIAKEFDGKASQYFGYLPRMRFAIVPVPPDQAPFYTSGRGGPGTYLVNTYDLPSRSLYSLPALTLHESAPGHAFQMPIAMEHRDLPPFRESYISAFGEGWALYCERLGTEMGMYHTPYETFGMLSYQAWRASRLVVDTGIHSKGWTRERAQNYLKENTALSEHEVETEVDRYISWPGQALSYYLGQMSIQRARKKAETALGPRFNIRAFHDTILELGSVPLPVLEERIDRFIAAGGKGPYPDMEQ
jgi:uncharacterized protein (DUF885 family)